MAHQKIRFLLWGKMLDNEPWYIRRATVFARYVYALTRDLVSGQLSLHAMSLVYSTLLAVVPLIAFSFSVLKGFGFHRDLQPMLFRLLQPLGAQGETITLQVIEMVDNVRGGVLGGLSLAIFLYTAISMVQKVETSFNYVWHVNRPRSLSRRISEYVSVLLVGPLVMVIALGSIASLKNSTVLQHLISSQWIGPISLQFGKLLPFLLITLFFTALYQWIPNTRVRFRSALLGGVVAGLLWSVISVYFAAFVVFSTRTLIIYAGFAIAITTLIWLYINWLIMLLGAQLAFYHQNRAYLRIGRHDPQVSVATREKLALNVMWLIGDAFRKPGNEVTIADIARRLGMPGIIVDNCVAELEAAGLIAATQTEELVPASDINSMRITDILEAVRNRGDSGFSGPPNWTQDVTALAQSYNEGINRAVGEMTLAQLITEQEPPAAASDAATSSPQ